MVIRSLRSRGQEGAHRWTTLALALASLAAVAMRVWVLAIHDELSADEVLPGLMGLHIAAGREWPVFYYGQYYLGATEAYLLAGLFKVAGFHPWLVVAPALAATATLTALTWALGRRLAGDWGGWLAALLVIAPPPILGRLMAGGGGFALAFALHSAALLCLLHAFDGDATDPPAGRRRAAGWGAAFSLCSGMLCWIWQPALALYPVLVGLLLLRWIKEWTLLHALVAVAPVLLGLAPMLSFNALHGWPTVTQLLSKYLTPAGEADTPLAAGGLPSLVLIALGGGDEAQGGPNLVLARLAGVAVPVAMALLLLAHAPAGAARRSWRPARDAALLAVAALVDGVAAHATARHLAPVALLAYVFTGAAFALLCGLVPMPGPRRHPQPESLRTAAGDAGGGPSGRRRPTWSRVWLAARALALVACAGLLVAPNVRMTAHAGTVFQHFVPRASEVQAAVRALDARGLSRGYSDYWTAYPIVYFSGERIVVAPSVPTIWGGRFDRYPAYTAAVDAMADPHALFLLLDGRCAPDPYVVPLAERGAHYQVEAVGTWYLLWDVQPAEGTEAETLAAWREVINTRAGC